MQLMSTTKYAHICIEVANRSTNPKMVDADPVKVRMPFFTMQALNRKFKYSPQKSKKIDYISSFSLHASPLQYPWLALGPVAT